MRKLNIEKMRKHAIRDTPDQKIWYIDRMTEQTDAAHLIAPWKIKVEKKYKLLRIPIAIDVEVMDEIDYYRYKVVARVVRNPVWNHNYQNPLMTKEEVRAHLASSRNTHWFGG